MIKIQGMDINLKLIILPIVNITLGIIVYLILKRIIANELEKKNIKESQLQKINKTKILLRNIINYSNNNSLAVVDISVAYETKEGDIEKAFQLISEKLNGKVPLAKKDIEFWGVNELSASSVVYREAETEPMKQFMAERFLRKKIKKIFDESKIKIPYQQIEVHNGK